MSKRTTKTVAIGRSAKTGRFVPVKYAEKHPATTVVEQIPVKKSGK